ncbi:MAG: class I SAM-dependent methyltransferase [Anaerolineae bacterium]
MDALEQWQARVLEYRRERGESDDRIWQRRAAWYDRWVAHNDYVALVLPKLLRLVGPSSRVLEVGPGTGAFTLPLARTVAEVVAVEPSPDLGTVLQHHLAQEGIGNVYLLASRIEEALEHLQGPFDLALASHSLYNVLPIDRVVRGLVRLSSWTAILTGTGEQKAWFRALYTRFRGREPVSPMNFRDLYPVLLQLGIYADVEILETSSNYVFVSENELVDRWAEWLQVQENLRPVLRMELRALAERRDQHVGIYGRTRTALILIHQERHVFAAPSQ